MASTHDGGGGRSGTMALVAALAVLAAGCTATLDVDGLESQIMAGIQDQVEVEIDAVDGPDEITAEAGATFECTASAPDGSTATVTVTQDDDQGNVTWEVTEVSE